MDDGAEVVEGEAAENSGEVVTTAISPGIARAIEILRHNLLDIGKRNRLIHTPRGNKRAKQIEIIDELSDEVFGILVRGRKIMSFLPLPESPRDGEDGSEGDQAIYLPPEDDETDEDGVAARHIDNRLQTELTREALQKKILTLYRDAQSMEEEQGVNVLFLGIGFLRWFESDTSDVERFAPLILLPIDLTRGSVRSRFKLSLRDQDLEPNLSLRALLENDFQVPLPDLPEGEDWCPSDYFQTVSEAIADNPRWQVDVDAMVLGFYSFGKFLMWRDLDPKKWPEGTGFAGNNLIEGLLVNGFDADESLFTGEENLDEYFIDPKDLSHILDADASQTQVIASAREGRNLVVQGPPGTGKSQTIANIIAVAARDGKKVLFVAEKMAALEVVHRRLKECQLGPLCLELHSRKANKKAVLEEMRHTLQLGVPRDVDESKYDKVRALRDELNQTSKLLHSVDSLTGATPFGVIGRIAKLQVSDCPPPDFALPDATTWSHEDYELRRSCVSRLAKRTGDYGSEREHIWRGVRKRLTPMDRDRLLPLLNANFVPLENLSAVLKEAAEALSKSCPEKLTEAKPILDQLDAWSVMPDLVPELLRSSVLVDQQKRALEVAEQINEFQIRKASILEDVTDNALEMKWDEVRAAVAAHGKGLFRILNSRYRDSIAEIRSVCRSTLPAAHEERIALLDQLLDLRRRNRELHAEAKFGRDAFGDRWRTEKTNTNVLVPALEWIATETERSGSCEAVANAVLHKREGAQLAELADALRQCQEAWAVTWTAVAGALDICIEDAFGVDEIDSIALGQVRSRLQDWCDNLETIEDWRQLFSAAEEASALSLDEIRTRLACRAMSPGDAEDLFQFACAEALWTHLSKKEPRLDALNGAERTKKVLEFREIDDQLKLLAAQELSLQHHRSLPRGGAGEMGILRGEIGKKSRHWALRKLMDRAGNAIINIKPIFLMSPLSVAQYLRPGGVKFDLLLIDEASQIRPEDALGAIVRAKQVVVVGDTQQLPPTSFFDRQIEAVETDEEEADEDVQASQVGDMESILTLCSARSLPGETLRWHYRSKHPSLIAVSSHTFYDNRLVFPPSPDEAGVASGLSFMKIAGVYDRGGKRNNPIEAKAVAKSVLEHARSRPDLTLGVVTFSVAQREAIRNELEFLRAENPELEAFCHEGKDERFFVKNLENVQGDERDTIFISVGYGPDANGYMSQSFGPVSSDGGERRLNVLFTRAKLSCRVFASITHHDVRDDVSRHAGPRVLKRYLKFAETGEMDVPAVTGREMDSPFEEAVASAIRKAGFAVAAQIGSAGFLVDLAIYDPDNEGRFLLGIECDGARYHSSRWARERDRLRQTVLESKGWTIHRIWSTDWFRKPEAEMQKLLGAIDRAKASQSELEPKPASRLNRVVERDLPKSNEGHKSIPYIEAEFDILENQLYELHEAPLSCLEDLVSGIIEIEAPIHIEEIGRRSSRLWGYKRAGARIQTAILGAVRSAVEKGQIEYCADGLQQFLKTVGDSRKITIRDRSVVNTSTIRHTEMLPPVEVQAAILEVTERNIAIRVEECAIEVARLFGFMSTSAEMRQLVESEARTLIRKGRLADVEGHLQIREGKPASAANPAAQ